MIILNAASAEAYVKDILEQSGHTNIVIYGSQQITGAAVDIQQVWFTTELLEDEYEFEVWIEEFEDGSSQMYGEW